MISMHLLTIQVEYLVGRYIRGLGAWWDVDGYMCSSEMLYKYNMEMDEMTTTDVAE